MTAEAESARPVTSGWLRWSTILLPALFVSSVQLALYFLLEPAFGEPGGHLMAAALMVAGIVFFSLVVFRLLMAKERIIVAQAWRAEALHEIGAELSASLDAETLIPLVVERAQQLLQANAAGLALMEETTGTLHWHHMVGIKSHQAVRSLQLRPGEGVAGWIVASERPLRIEDCQARLPDGLDSVPILEQEGLRSLLGVRLRSGTRMLGALVVANDRPRVFTEAETTLLASLANQVAIALANAELYASARLAAEQLERLIEGSGDGIITTDLQGRITSWNDGAEAIYGWTREEAVGASIPMVPPDGIKEAMEIIHKLVVDGDTLVNIEVERIRKDGQLIPVVVTGSPIQNAVGTVVGVLGISKDMSGHRQLERQQRRLALLEDRERIGMELHDGAIQSLYAVGLGLEATAQVVESNPSLALNRLAQARDNVNRVIAEIRNYILGLRGDTFARSGLAAGLAELAHELQANTSTHVDADIQPSVDRGLDQAAAEDVYQIAREALANVARHSGATAATVSVHRNGKCWRLQVRDNGRGFDAALPNGGGFGLGNMRARAQRLGAEFQLTTDVGGGTAIQVLIPATHEGEGHGGH
ncbi:MAG: PAS domain S-box protein [Chloroflexota bacterium]|nr:PAS domain S-box protein [Chloroflexota bacterium]